MARCGERPRGDGEVMHGASVDEMFLDDALEVVRGTWGVPCALGIDDGDGAGVADLEAIGLGAGDGGAVADEAEFLEAALEELP